MYPAGGFALNLLPDGRTFKLYSIQMRKRRHQEDYRHDLGRLLQLLSEGKISPVIAQRFDLREAAAAHELLAQKAFPGKIVLTVAD
jgi:NADPH:quinone reductase-like Zn-dependent oxidoreductase